MKKLILLFALIMFQSGYSQIVNLSALTTGTITGNATQQDETVIHDAGATLTLTVALPSNPKNAQIFIFASAGGITTLTLSSVTGTISNALTTMAAGGNATYVYSTANTKWYKIR